jgi:hypothetical protein
MRCGTSEAAKNSRLITTLIRTRRKTRSTPESCMKAAQLRERVPDYFLPTARRFAFEQSIARFPQSQR